MRLISTISIDRTPEQVWDFSMNVQNLARWDHSVDRVEVVKPGNQEGVGLQFDTIAPSRSDKPGKRMHYRATKGAAQKFYEAELFDDPMFRYASWRFDLEPTPTGTLVTCTAVFKFSWRYLWLAPILRFSKSAITRDLGYFKARVEEDYPASASSGQP